MADAKPKQADPKPKPADTKSKQVDAKPKPADAKRKRPKKPKEPRAKKAAGDGQPKKKVKRDRPSLLDGGYIFYKSKKPKKETPPKPRAKKPTFIVKPIGGEKNGGTRKVLVKKRRKFYPTSDRIKKAPSRRRFTCKPSVRKTLVRGRVVIVLTGPHKGKRVIVLKALKSGMLLVTGPRKYNGCPLRRISQRYVIATTTKLNLRRMTLPSHLDDKYFKRIRPKRPKKEEGDIFAAKKEPYKVTEERKKDQVIVDKQVIRAIKSHKEKEFLPRYLKSLFTLGSSQCPHRMKF